MRRKTLLSKKLISPEEALKRGHRIARTLELLYGGPAVVRLQEVPTENLLPTEPFLERTKLGLVLRSVLVENYGAPVVVLKEGARFFIMDGHHRAYVYWLTGRVYIGAITIRVTTMTYNKLRKTWSFWEMGLFNDKAPADPLERLWRFMAGVVHFYTRKSGGAFRLKLEEVALDKLVPTQLFVESERVASVKKNRLAEEPILCLEKEGRTYILDGHARSLIHYEQGADKIEALVLYPIRDVGRLGIERAVEKMGLQTLADVSII